MGVSVDHFHQRLLENRVIRILIKTALHPGPQTIAVFIIMVCIWFAITIVLESVI